MKNEEMYTEAEDVIIMVVYIPQSAKANKVLIELSSLQNTLSTFDILTGDFNF